MVKDWLISVHKLSKCDKNLAFVQKIVCLVHFRALLLFQTNGLSSLGLRYDNRCMKEEEHFCCVCSLIIHVGSVVSLVL
jgi:hypothetical protein